MKRIWRSLGALAAILILIGLAFVAVPTDRIARLAADRLEQATGRTLTIDGAMRARLWPSPGIVAEAVRLENAPWSRQGPMLVAERMEIGLAPASLFRGPLRISSLDLTGAAITLERRADGIGNWETSALAPEPTQPRAPAPKLDQIRLTGAEIAWIDHRNDRVLRLRAVDLTAQLPDPTRPTALKGSALIGSRAVKLAGRVDDLGALLDGGLQAITLSLSSGGSAVTLDGLADLAPLAFDGTVDARSDDRFALLRDIGVAVPDLPRGLGAGRVALTSGLVLAPGGSVHLRGMDLALDGNRVTGDLDITQGAARPRIVGTLDAKALNLDMVSRKGQGGESALMGETGWGRTPLDAQGLQRLDAELAVTTGPISLGDAHLSAATLAIRLDAGRAAVTLDALRAYGGTIAGDVVIGGRDAVPSLSLDLDVQGVALGPALAGVANAAPLTGEADATIQLAGAGATALDLVASLEGAITVAMAEGRIEGVDLLAMIRDGHGSPAPGTATPFQGAIARLSVAAGQVVAEDVRVDTASVTLGVEGSLTLPSRRMDLRLTPARGAIVPILASGRWMQPRVSVDRAFLLARAEAQARAREAAQSTRRAREQATRQARQAAETRRLADAPERDAAQAARSALVEQELRSLITGGQ